MRTTILAVVVLAVSGAPAQAEEVLYCTETGANGFSWDKKSPDGRRTHFNLDRYTVKIISETRRTITAMTGDTKGQARHYSCKRPYTTIKKVRIVCDDGYGDVPWIFHDNTFMRALLSGPPTGGGDPNAFISYGTCVKF